MKRSPNSLRAGLVAGLIAATSTFVGCPEPHGTIKENAGKNAGGTTEEKTGTSADVGNDKTTVEPAVSADEQEAIEALNKQGSKVTLDSAGHAKEVDLRAPINDEVFLLVGRLPELQKLLAKGPDVKDSSLGALKGLKNLRTIDFDQADVGDEGLAMLVDLPLVDINLKLTNVRDEGVKHLASIKTIRNMRLIKTKVTDAGVAHLKDHPAIEFLDLQDVNTCGNASLETAATLPKLKKLRVYGPQYNDAGMEHVGKITNLASLSMEQTGVGDAGLEKIAGLTELKELLMYGTQISDAGLNKLTGLSKLTELELRGTATGADLAWLKQFPALKILSLEESYFSDEGMPALLEAKTLEELNLRMATLKKESLQQLAALTGLKRLNLDQLKACDDDVCTSLTALENLEFIHVGSTSVTDAGVNALVGALKKLKKIDVSRLPNVSQSNVENIRKANPKLEVVF